MNLSYFDTHVRREGIGNLKRMLTPEHILDAGVQTYWGAEFEFPTCPAFMRGAAQCAMNGSFAFTVQDSAYNDRVVWWLKEMRGWDIRPEWVQATHGTIFALATAIRLFTRPGENLIVLTPGYNRYAQAAERLGRGCVNVPMTYAAGAYTIDELALEKAMADRHNTLLCFSQPNNPTGKAYTRDELRLIADLSRRYETPVFSDEIFAEVTLTDSPVVPYLSVAGEEALAIACTSLGKSMSLTGVNHANAIISNPRLQTRYDKQRYADHFGSIDPMVYAGFMAAAGDEGADFVRSLNRYIRQNVADFTEGIERLLPGVHVSRADATFVAWVDYTGLGMSDDGLADFLCNHALLYGSEGAEYAASNQFWRYNLAVPHADILDSLKRLGAAAHTIL